MQDLYWTGQLDTVVEYTSHLSCVTALPDLGQALPDLPFALEPLSLRLLSMPCNTRPINRVEAIGQMTSMGTTAFQTFERHKIGDQCSALGIVEAN